MKDPDCDSCVVGLKGVLVPFPGPRNPPAPPPLPPRLGPPRGRNPCRFPPFFGSSLFRLLLVFLHPGFLVCIPFPRLLWLGLPLKLPSQPGRQVLSLLASPGFFLPPAGLTLATRKTATPTQNMKDPCRSSPPPPTRDCDQAKGGWGPAQR